MTPVSYYHEVDMSRQPLLLFFVVFFCCGLSSGALVLDLRNGMHELEPSDHIGNEATKVKGKSGSFTGQCHFEPGRLVWPLPAHLQTNPFYVTTGADDLSSNHEPQHEVHFSPRGLADAV